MTKNKVTLDLGDFKPEPKIADTSKKEEVKNLALSAGFSTTHSQKKTTKEMPVGNFQNIDVSSEPKRRGRKRSTNRNTPFAVKLKLETNNRIYEIADELECTAIAEVIEQAIEALDKELTQRKVR